MDRELLLEIGVEELPASWLPPLTSQIGARLQARLAEVGLGPKGGVEAFATPRRLTACVTDLIDRGDLSGTQYLRVNIHTIDAEAELAALSPSSKLNADRAFQQRLRELGVEKASAFLDTHFDDIGHRSSTDIAAKFF